MEHNTCKCSFRPTLDHSTPVWDTLLQFTPSEYFFPNWLFTVITHLLSITAQALPTCTCILHVSCVGRAYMYLYTVYCRLLELKDASLYHKILSLAILEIVHVTSPVVCTCTVHLHVLCLLILSWMSTSNPPFDTT